MKLLIYLILSSLSLQVIAKDLSAVEHFEQGIQSHKQKNYEEAKAHFLNSLKLNPESTSTLYNMGLSEYSLGQLGTASAYWKKTLALNPFHQSARNSLKLIENKISFRNKNTYWNKFRNYILNFLPIQVAYIIFTLLFCVTMALLIQHFTRRHIALKNYLPLPEFNKLAIGLIAAFSFMLIVVVAKTYDHYNPRAVIISDTTPLFISPDEKDIQIMEVSQGEEVIVTKTQDGWSQVKTFSGNFGWVLQNNLLQISGVKNK